MAGRAAAGRTDATLERPDPDPDPAGTLTLPPEFDYRAYVDHPGNGDVRTFDETAAVAHYAAFGRGEGRVCSAVSSREDFLGLVPADADVLEIGPFWDPSFRRAERPTVRYLDALSTEQLRARAAGLAGADPSRVPEIDYVWQGEPYAELTGRRFDVVYSSHVIEHTPCLIKHLREVGSILHPGGRYFLTIPDKRYCFDHYMPETTIGDVLDAFLIGRTNRHSARTLINEALYHVHNDSQLHWTGDHWPDPKQRPITPELMARLGQTVKDYQKNEGYIDAHAWMFTPASFRTQIDMMAVGGMIPFRRERVYDTLASRVEFYAVLRTAPQSFA